MSAPDRPPTQAEIDAEDAAWVAQFAARRAAYRERVKHVGTPPRTLANVRASGAALRFVGGVLAALVGVILLAYGVAAVWE